MRLVSLCSVVFTLVASLAHAQGAHGTSLVITGKGIIGGSVPSPSLLPDTLRLLGVRDVVNGSATINPVVRDNDGDVLEDTNTTVSTAGAWTFGGAGSFTSTLGVTGVLSGNTGTLLLGSPTRISGTTPSFRLHESDAGTSAKYSIFEADTESLYLKFCDDTPSACNSVFRVDRTGIVPGDLRFGSLLNTIRPENNGGSNLGSLTKKYLTLHAWELWVDTLVAKRTIATIGGRIFVAPTTKLVRDLAAADACMSVEDNEARVNDTVLLQKNGKFEKILIGANPVDCSVSGNCAVTFTGYNLCSLTRNRDGTGANDWAAGDAVLNEGNTGDGYIDLYADRSATSEGYPGHVVSDGPVAYWRMNETTSTTTADVMGNVGVATETGTQSNGLGVLSTSLGTTSSDPVWQNTNAGGYLLVANDTDLQITADFTLEFWAFWENGGGTDNVISRGGNSEYHLQVAATGAATFCHGNGSSNECETTASGYFSTGGDYHHYAIVRDATSSPKRILFYKDGALFGSPATYTQTVTAQTLTLGIGTNPQGVGSEFDGNIDEVAIYNYQLAADRILLHYNARLNNSISKFTVGPTLCGNVRTGTAAFDVAERWCMGNLAGTYGYASSPTAVYGFAAGNASATWLSADATNGFRIMNGSTTKLQADTSGNLSLTGDLSIGTAGSLRSGATAYDTGTGYWLDYNSGTPRFRIGTTSAGANYLRWTGSALEIKSNELTLNNNGIALNARSTDSFNSGHSYGFNIANTSMGMWAFANTAPNSMDLRLQSHTTASLTQARINMTVSDEDSDVAGININTGTTASSDSNINFSAQSITVDVSNTGATANLSCGAGQAIKTLNVRKGIIIGTPTCGAP